MKPNILIIPAILIMLSISDLYAQDWPQYLGPDRNGISDQKNILTSWPEEGPEVLWNVDVGIGFGGPVIKDGKVYLLDRNDEFGDKLRCFNLSDGKEIWKFEYAAPGSVMFPGSRSVPTLDGKYIYTVGPYGDLYCIDITSHKPVWHKNVWKDYGGGEIPTWAITQCPLVADDLLIVASQAPEAGVVAYNKLTGEVKWKTASLGTPGYVSPTLVNVSGEQHVVMISASARRGGGLGKVVGMKPDTGEILWEYTGWQCRIPIPNAVEVGNGRMLITGGYEAGSAMIEVEKNADGSYNVKEIYKTEDFGTHTKPPIMHDGYFYAQYSTNERRDGLVCMSMDGKIMWKTGRTPAFVRGSMILANGLILATDGENALYLIKPDASEFKPIAKAEMFKAKDAVDPRFGVQNWAPIALADGRLIIRDQGLLLCIKVAETK